MAAEPGNYPDFAIPIFRPRAVRGAYPSSVRRSKPPSRTRNTGWSVSLVERRDDRSPPPVVRPGVPAVLLLSQPANLTDPDRLLSWETDVDAYRLCGFCSD